MFQLFEYGEIVLQTISTVGDFLLYTPEYLTIYNPVLEYSFEIPNPFGSIGSMVVGGGLVFLLVYKLIKFFTDIVL